MNIVYRRLFAALTLLILPIAPSYASEEAASEPPIQIEDLPSHNVIVFGELHGTNEIPAFFGDQIESLLEAGHSVHVGLELSASEQEGIRHAMTLSESDQHRALLQLEQWRNTRDGRNSVAMARMLSRLGNLRTAFEDRLSVFSFDVGADWRGESNDRDQFMADNIGAVRSQIPDESYLLVLTGNAHAFGVPGAPWDSDFRSMAVRLKETHPVLSLRNLQTGGTAWICTPECGARKINGTNEERQPGIYLEPFDSDWSEKPVHEGVFFVGELTASEPLPVAVDTNDQARASD
ncbi:MAG: hypothetical protein U5L08_15220 [Xanthomonadales bacterium]|nr:hypothetical protein [Xanthomonadales bacterium]